MTELPAPPGDVDVALRPYRRPVRLLEGIGMTVAVVAIFCWLGGALFVWARAPRAVALTGAIAAAAATLILWWRSDHRRYPAGRLAADEAGLKIDDGLRSRLVPWEEMRFVVGTGLGLVLKGAGRRVIVDWPRFQPLAPREVVEALLTRVAARPEGAQILQRTAQQTRRSAGIGRIIFWVCLVNGVLVALRLIFERLAPHG